MPRLETNQSALTSEPNPAIERDRVNNASNAEIITAQRPQTIGGKTKKTGSSSMVTLSPVPKDAVQGQKGPLIEVLRTLNLRTELSNAAESMSLDLQQEALVSAEGKSTPLIRIELKDGSCLKFRKDLGELVYYINKRQDDVPRLLTHDDAIDVEVARRSAQDIVNNLGWNYDLSLAPNKLQDLFNPNDLYAANWHFELFQTYEGFKTNGYIGIMVSAYNGKVKMVTRMPLVIPENIDIRVDERAALESVARFAERAGLRVDKLLVTDKWIGPPNPTIWAVNADLKQGPDLSNPRPFYQVFAIDPTKHFDTSNYSDAYSYYFHVDCYTGEIIGGGGRESKQRGPELAASFERLETQGQKRD
jgi:hypothetical protein